MARKRLTELPEGLWRKLAELEDYVRQLAVVRGFGWTLALAAICVALALMADMSFELPLFARLGLLGLSVCVTVASLFAMIWRPWSKARSPVELAALVEQAHPELRESLVSTIELYDPEIPENERGSPLMRELAARQALQNVARLDFTDAVSSRPAHRMAICGLIAWAMLLLPLTLPSSYRLLFFRFLAPWENLDRVSSFWFDVEQGDRVVVRGSDVTLSAHPRGAVDDIPETVLLNWHDAQDESDSRRIDFDATRQVYTTTLPHVMHDFEYYLTGAGNRSKTYRIKVVEGPAITSVKLEIQPPAYTGQPAQLMDTPSSEIRVLEHSRLNWKMTFNKPVQVAEWQWLQSIEEPGVKAGKAGTATSEPVATPRTTLETMPLKLSADRLTATWGMVPERSGEFRLAIRDEYGLTNDFDGSRALSVLPDIGPIINYVSGHETETARATDIIPLDIEAIDDVGVGALELHAEVDQSRKIVMKCEPRELGSATVQHRFNLELASLQVKYGDIVTYRVRAADERPVPGPNETWSERRMIRIDDKAKAPGTEQLAATQEQLRESLKQLIDGVKLQTERAGKLSDEAEEIVQTKEGEELKAAVPDARKKVEAAADQQAQLQAKLDEITNALTRHPLFSNLSEQTRQLAEKEFADAQRELSDAEQAELPEQSKKLQTAQSHLQVSEQKLSQLEKQFDKLAKLEQDLLELNRLAANAEQLARRLRDLERRQNEPPRAGESDKEKESRNQLEQAERHQLLADQKQLTKQAEELMRRQPELQQAANQNLADQFDQLARKAEELAQPQQQVADDLQKAAQAAAKDSEQLAQRQQELREQAEQLNKQLAQQDQPQARPVDPAQVDKALEQLQAGNLGKAAEEQARLAKQIEELEEQLRKAEQQPQGEPAEVAQQLAKQQADTAKSAREAADKGQMNSGKQQAAAQQELADRQRQLNQLPQGAAKEEQQAAKSALDKAAATQQALAGKPAERSAGEKTPDNQGNGKPAESEPAGQKPDQNSEDVKTPANPEQREQLADNAAAQEKAAEALQKLADQLAKQSPPQDKSDADRAAAAQAQQLANQQAKAAEAAGKAAEQKTAPSVEQQQAAAEQTAKAQDELQKLNAGKAVAQQQAAKESLKQAADEQQALAEQSRDPKSAKAQPGEKELEKQLQDNAQAQQAAADALQKLANELKQPGSPKPPMPQGEQVASANPGAKSDQPTQPSNSPDSGSPDKAGEKSPSGQGQPEQNQAANQHEQRANDQQKKSSSGSPMSMPDGKSAAGEGANNPQADQAQQLAKAARALQKDMEQARQDRNLADAKATQQKLTDSLNELKQEMEQVQKKLDQKPASQVISPKKDTPQDDKARSLEEARQAMQVAQEELRKGNPDSACKACNKAAAALRGSKSGPAPQGQSAAAAANGERSPKGEQERTPSAPNGSSTGQNPGAVPDETATQVAQAVEQLKEALESSPAASRQPKAAQGDGAAAGGKATQKSNGASPMGSAQPMAGQSPQNGASPMAASPMNIGAEPGGSAETSSSNGKNPGSQSASKAAGNQSAGDQTGNAPSGQPAASGAGKPGSGQPEGKAGPHSASQPAGVVANPGNQPSAMESAAQRLTKAADALRQASAQSQPRSPGGGNNAASQPQDSSTPPEEGGGLAQGGQGAPGQKQAAEEGAPEQTVAVDGDLQRLKKRLKGRKWGELPGTLQTEILQAAQKKPNSEYADLIRQYFKEIAKTQPAAK